MTFCLSFILISFYQCKSESTDEPSPQPNTNYRLTNVYNYEGDNITIKYDGDMVIEITDDDPNYGTSTNIVSYQGADFIQVSAQSADGQHLTRNDMVIENNLLSEVKHYYKGNSQPEYILTHKTEYEYSSDGFLNELNYENDNGSLELSRIATNIYNNGKITETIEKSYEYGGWNNDGKCLYEYNELDLERVLCYTFDENNWELKLRYIIEYNELGFIRSVVQYNNYSGEWEISWQRDYEYDEHGNITKIYRDDLQDPMRFVYEEGQGNLMFFTSIFGYDYGWNFIDPNPFY